MDIQTLRKVIDLYLRGFGYQEISKRTGIARSTVQDTVNRWREGQTGIFDQALSYVDEITEIARDMRQNGTRIEDVKMPFLNASVLKNLNIDLQELYSFYDAVRGYGPDVIPAMAKTVIALQSHGMDPAGMVQKLESLGNEIKEMENRKDHLAQDLSAVDKELKAKNGAKASLEKEVSELRESASSLKKQGKTMADGIKRDSGRIAKSDRFWSAVEGMGIDPARIGEFMESARSMGYDARTIPDIREIEKYGMDRSMSPDDMRTLVVSLRQLNSAGWSPDSIVKLSIAMGGVADTPGAVIDHMRKYSKKYRNVDKAIEELDRQLSAAHEEHEVQIGNLQTEAEEIAAQIGDLQRTRDSIDSEITELNRKKEEAESEYRQAVEILRQYTGSVVSMIEIRDVISRQNKMKKDLETSIGALNSKLAGMKISADVAGALPSIITGRDMKTAQLCAAFTAGGNSNEVSEEMIRDRIINDIIEISEGGIVPVHYSSYDRFISGSQYDHLMKLDRERIKISEEKTELEKLRNLYGRDIESYLNDYLSGKLPGDSAGYRMIREIAEKSFLHEVQQRLDLKAFVEIGKDSGAGNPLIFLAAPGGSSGRVDVGSISIQELVAGIRSGSGTVEMQTGNGKVSLDTCTAVMELLEMYLNPATLEMLRKAWRESVITKTDKHEKAGLPRYGGLINRDQMGERKRSG